MPPHGSLKLPRRNSDKRRRPTPATITVVALQASCVSPSGKRGHSTNPSDGYARRRHRSPRGGGWEDRSSG